MVFPTENQWLSSHFVIEKYIEYTLCVVRLERSCVAVAKDYHHETTSNLLLDPTS